MVKYTKVTLDDDLEKKFDDVKKSMALTVDAEVYRKLLIEKFRELFPEVEEVVIGS